MSFDRRKSTQMTLSSNMTGSRLPAVINPAQIAKCKQRAFLTCGYTTVIFGLASSSVRHLNSRVIYLYAKGIGDEPCQHDDRAQEQSPSHEAVFT
jgi:hypothetical protein